MHKKLKPLTLALLLASSLPATAGSFSQLYLFGDSLTDSGAFAGQAIPNGSGGFSLLPADARWTIDNVANHADVLAGKLGLSVKAANAGSTLGSSGNNFAQGGAQSVNYATGATLPGGGTQGPGPGGLDIRDLPQQVQDYLTAHGGQADPAALYFVWTGGNDIPTAAAAGSSSAAGVAVAAAQSQVAQIAALKNAGAKLIMAPNLPSFGNTPAAFFAIIDGNSLLNDTQKNALKAATANVLRSGSTLDSTSQQARIGAALDLLAAQLSGATSGAAFDTVRGQLASGYQTASKSLNDLTTVYNLAADTAIANSGANVIRANVNALFAEALANPAAFGFSNVTGPACGGNAASGVNSSLVCSSSQIGSETYLFADDRHPSPQTHQMLGQYFASLVLAPEYALAMGSAVANDARAIGSQLQARLQQGNGQVGSLGAFSSVLGGKQNLPGGKQDGALLTLGIDYQQSDSLKLGLAFSQGKRDISLGTLGNIDADHQAISTLAGYQQDNWWLNGSFTLGSADLDSRRSITLGTLNRTESGKTRANYHQLQLQAGLTMPYAGWQGGPRVGLSLTGGRVAALTETSLSSTGMRFDKQKLDSQQLQLGWQAQRDLGNWQPYVALDFVSELGNNTPALTAGLTSNSSQFRYEGQKRDKQWLQWQTGVRAKLGDALQGYLQVQGSSGRSGENATQYQLGLAAQF